MKKPKSKTGSKNPNSYTDIFPLAKKMLEEDQKELQIKASELNNEKI